MPPFARRPTLQDVAELANVSRSTACFILRRHEPQFSRYASETIKRVQEAAKQVGYRANLMASSLGLQRSPFFGVSFQLIGETHRDPIGTHAGLMWEVFDGITRAALASGRYPVFLTNLEAGSDRDAFDKLDRVVQSGLSGVIASVRPETWKTHMARWEERGMPCVSLFDRGTRRAPRWHVDLDNRAAGRLTSEYLLRRGHRSVLCVWDWQRSRAQIDRLKAFRNAHVARGGTAAFLRLSGWIRSFGREGARGEALLREALDRSGATAIFAASGGAAMNIHYILQRREFRIPDDYSFVGIDVPSTQPESAVMTEIVCPGRRLGYEAAHLLAKRIEGEATQPTGVLVAPELVERESVATVGTSDNS